MDTNTWEAMNENIFWLCTGLFSTLWLIFIYMICKKKDNTEIEQLQPPYTEI